MAQHYDIAIIGGGINGCGIARDAAGRGYKVFLCEMNDLASGTSSWSTKLVHGGLRYLEYYEFRLVREALTEREVLLRMAPHLIRPLRFVLPHHEGLRPAWLLRLGLFLYDHIGGRKLLPATRTLDLSHDAAGAPLKSNGVKAFEYSDCRVDDTRLVIANARDAADRGAVISPRTRAIDARRANAHWELRTRSSLTGAAETVTASALINAAGPWVADVLATKLGVSSGAKVRLVKGAHIVLKKLFDHDRAYIFQNGDGRIVFAIPYEGDFTLIGTTDTDVEGDPAKVAATDADVDYLCRAASEYFIKPILRSDIVWKFAGVRPLYDDGASDAKSATRDYVFELDAKPGQAPLLSIFGGKITTYRRLAEAALAQLNGTLPGPNKQSLGWSSNRPLPGGDFPADGRLASQAGLEAEYPFLDPAFARRLVHTYGTRANRVLGSARSLAELGHHFGATLSEAEVRYLMTHEWALTAEDVIWRRTKLGLRLPTAQVTALDEWMQAAIVTQEL